MKTITKILGIGMLSLIGLAGCEKKENQNLKYLGEFYMEHYDLMELRRYSFNKTAEQDSLMGVKMIELIDYYKDLESRLSPEDKIEADKLFNRVFGYEARKIPSSLK